jgi:hypothetical protein
VSDFFTERAAEPAPAAPIPPAAQSEPEPVVAAAANPLFEEELDVPAYLRQGKLLN